MDKKSFILYTSFYEPIKGLTKEEKGALLDAIFQYAMGEDIELWPQGRVSMAFEFIRSAMKSDNEKWKRIKQKRSEAGKLGGAPKGNTNASKQSKQANVCFDKQKQAKQAKQAVNVNNNIISSPYVEDINSVIKNNLTSTKVDVSDLASDAAVTPRMVVEEWNRATKGIWGTIKSMDTSSTRWKMVRARIASEGWEGFKAAILTATKSQYLTGGEATWFSFDWFIKPNNFCKVRDGNYLNTKTHNDNGIKTDNQRRRAVIDIAGFTQEDYSEPL